MWMWYVVDHIGRRSHAHPRLDLARLNADAATAECAAPGRDEPFTTAHIGAVVYIHAKPNEFGTILLALPRLDGRHI